MQNVILITIVLLHIILSEALGGYLSIKKLINTEITESKKVNTYKSTILNGWTSVVFVIGVVVFTDITFADIGFKMISINFEYLNVWISAGILVACLGFMLLLIYQIISFKISKKYRKNLREQLERKPLNDAVDMLLPKTKREKKWWTLVSATAGITEEVYYRGFLLYLAISLFPNLSIYLILIAINIVFGVAHSYQGLTGLVKTALMGLVFCMLYLVTGLIIPGMFLHFVIDFASNFLFDDQPETQA